MEPLFSAVICGCNAGLFRKALHEVYIPRIQRGNASFAANILGIRGALLTVLVHFFKQGRWESPVEIGVGRQSLTADDQLFILTQAAQYLTALQGHASLEAFICYQRLESLCSSLNRPMLLYVTLIGQWRYSLFTDKLSATMQIAKRVYSLAQEQNDAALMMGACNVLAGTLNYLSDFDSARQYVMRGVQIWRSGSVPSHAGELESHAVVCLCFAALFEWHFGEIASYQATMAEAISLAKELNETNALAVALYFAALLGNFERNPAEVERVASDLIELSTLQSFSHRLALGSILRGWARSALGDITEGISWIEDGIEDYRGTGSMIDLPYLLSLKAEALYLADRTPEAIQTIREAEASVERFDARWWSAELHRLRGVFLTAMGAEEMQIEASFCAAIRTAREQKSVSLKETCRRNLC